MNATSVSLPGLADNEESISQPALHHRLQRLRRPLVGSGFVLFSIIACTLLSFSSSLRAEHRKEELIVLAEQHLEVHVRHLRQIYPEVKADIEGALGWKFISAPQVLLVSDREIFEKMSGNPLVSAFAVPARHSIVIYLPLGASDPYVLRETFEHELCHLLLHDHIRETPLPKWLDEGICQWVSGSFGEILEGRRVAPMDINLSRHPIPLQQLTISFPKEKDSLIQAYVESRLFVDFLVARYGKGALRDVLRHMKEGQPTDQAVYTALSHSLESLQGQWWEEVRGRNGWLLWVSRYLYEILFFFGALLTLLAYIRIMIRKRGYDPAEEDDV